MRISDWSSDVCSSDLIPPVLPHLSAGEAGEIGLLVKDGARAWLNQPQQQPPGRRLATTGLAYEPHGFPGQNGQIDAVDGAHGGTLRQVDEPAADGEVLGKTSGLDEVGPGGCRHGVASLGARASCGLARKSTRLNSSH